MASDSQSPNTNYWSILLRVTEVSAICCDLCNTLSVGLSLFQYFVHD